MYTGVRARPLFVVVIGIALAAPPLVNAHPEAPPGMLAPPPPPDVGGTRTDEYSCQLIPSGAMGTVPPVAADVPFHGGVHAAVTDVLLNLTVEDIDTTPFVADLPTVCVHADLDGLMDATGPNSGVYLGAVLAAGDLQSIVCGTGALHDLAPSGSALVLPADPEAPVGGLIFHATLAGGDAPLEIAHAEDADTVVPPKTGLGSGAGMLSIRPIAGNCVNTNVDEWIVNGAFHVAVE